MLDYAQHPALLLLLALGLDTVCGELPNAWHPVAWLGRAVDALRARLPLTPPLLAFCAGVLLLALSLAFVPLVVLALEWLARMHPHAWAVSGMIALFLLQASFARRALLQAGERVEDALGRGDLEAARSRLAWLCSRDASTLDEAQVAGAATASLAENLSDSVVGPLFYYVLFGLPGALAFRVINTLDAMVGYRGKYEWLGKAAARVDDLAGLIPARITALLLLLAGWATRLPGGRGLRVAWRDAHLTPSPNGGVVMAMCSGLLGVRLEKEGSYVLGAEFEDPTPSTLSGARSLIGRAGSVTFMAALLVTGLIESSYHLGGQP